ncbi:NAD(P)H-hydrate dehydratase [Dyadobacter psychrotolerans]|uniref:Bifunctional NAD(P)H-hydrate repair enzyme n=1 Tax=Dyadobacter psychrotolerans TaxID=2541721 RepID=A0A4R5DVQ1_9BACT|nr:NAD(P)H-hydrate dehydratase [Dyadobacter psychrotolerans]TDE16221.1 NAD(P)H-hydrate dehydratase [Dyadobacter psychrotolerans]
MKIFKTEQIRQADAYTIANAPISSLDLMERASNTFVRWFCNQFVNTRPIGIFCGKGNNGGDGLAIARLLSEKAYQVKVYIVEHSEDASEDFHANFIRLENHLTSFKIHSEVDLPQIPANMVIIDAMLGSGLSRAATGILAEVIQKLNDAPNKIVSVDIASGLYADRQNEKEDAIIKPHCTVSFQFPKLAFMMPQNAEFVGNWFVADIGLSENFISATPTSYFYTDKSEAECKIIPRKKFSHKGTFGHGLILAGSHGKMGAAILSGRACLRSGIGLLSMHIPGCGYEIMQISIPEAMVTVDPDHKHLSKLPQIESYSAIGIGPGVGKEKVTVQLLATLLKQIKTRLLIDADALNILSENPYLLDHLPEKTVLTPHPKEFQRLAGESKNEYERLELARDFAKKHKVIICLKGANTAVVLSNGDVHFNSTGNAGMATGGTGDVLTGIITSLLAQGYEPEDAAILGVYQHGLAGDKASEIKGQSAMIASDVIDKLGW